MGLDIYAGTLTRYYSHNWKTITQQLAEENGWGFQKITPGGGKRISLQPDHTGWRTC